MQREDRIYLEHMPGVAVRTHSKVACSSVEEWERDEDLRLAVAHLVQTLGEAARNVPDGGRAAHPGIPWREAIEMRNVIVLDDPGVDDRIVRAVALRGLPALIEALRRILGA